MMILFNGAYQTSPLLQLRVFMRFTGATHETKIWQEKYRETAK